MTKNKYMQPVMEIMQAEVEQIVAVSVTGVQTTGLNEGEKLQKEDTPKPYSVWNDAW